MLGFLLVSLSSVHHINGNKMSIRFMAGWYQKRPGESSCIFSTFPSRLQNKTKKTKYQCTLDVYQIKEIDNKMNAPLLLRR